MLTVGIHEGLRLGPGTKVNTSEKGVNLTIEFLEGENDMLSKFESNSTGEDNGGSLMIFLPDTKKFDKTAKTSGEVGNEIMQLRTKLMQYMELYASREEVESVIGGTKILEGIGLSPDKYNAVLKQLNKEAICKKISKNVVDIFIKFIQAQDLSVTFRHKFIRRSKEKHFASLPYSGKFVEPSNVECTLAYTPWEIKEGKNDPTPSLADKKRKRKEDAAALYGDSKEEDDLESDLLS